MTDTHVSEELADEYRYRTQDVVEPVAVAVVAAEPLRIVTHPTRDFTTGSVTLTAGQVTQLMGPGPFRDVLHVVNNGAGPVYIGADRDTLTQAGGFPLAPAARLSIRSRHAVYVLGDATLAGPTPVHWFAEYVDG